MITDPNVEEVRRVREELIKQHGGLDGYIKHLQAMDRERLRKRKQNRSQGPKVRAAKNGRTKRRRTAARV